MLLGLFRDAADYPIVGSSCSPQCRPKGYGDPAYRPRSFRAASAHLPPAACQRSSKSRPHRPDPGLRIGNQAVGPLSRCSRDNGCRRPSGGWQDHIAAWLQWPAMNARLGVSVRVSVSKL